MEKIFFNYEEQDRPARELFNFSGICLSTYYDVNKYINNFESFKKVFQLKTPFPDEISGYLDRRNNIHRYFTVDEV